MEAVSALVPHSATAVHVNRGAVSLKRADGVYRRDDRDKPKQHRADEVLLCGQAMCLEEMLGVTIPSGCLFYGETRRRTPVTFDDELRAVTIQAIERLHELIASRVTPLAVRKKKKCDNCSLIEICMPDAMRFKKGAAA